jgi:1,4-alpha-glucan branching enzyme
MGQEFAADQPFLFFCDLDPEPTKAVLDRRRRELARFNEFRQAGGLSAVPDPNDPATLQRTKLDWDSLIQPPHDEWLGLFQQLLTLRQQEIVPRLFGIVGGRARYEVFEDLGLRVNWTLGEGAQLSLLANLSRQAIGGVKPPPRSDIIYISEEGVATALAKQTLPPWSVAWFIEQGAEDSG